MKKWGSNELAKRFGEHLGRLEGDHTTSENSGDGEEAIVLSPRASVAPLPPISAAERSRELARRFASARPTTSDEYEEEAEVGQEVDIEDGDEEDINSPVHSPVPAEPEATPRAPVSYQSASRSISTSSSRKVSRPFPGSPSEGSSRQKRGKS